MTGSAAERFDQTLATSPADLTGPELLPSRLARACAAALRVDGAALSLHVGLLRTPIGASDAQTAHAERLQFTVGDGPCLRAQDNGTVIAFSLEDIARNWPELWASMLDETTYGGVLSVPLPPPMGPLVVLDLYVRDPAALTSLDRADVQEVARVTTQELAVTVSGAGFPDDGSNWLEGTDAHRRGGAPPCLGRAG